MPRPPFRATLLLPLLAVLASGKVVELHRGNWRVPGQTDWFIMFTQQGCSHCERFVPMWAAMEQELSVAGAAVRVGRVDSTENNGIAISFGVRAGP
jgi:hypothetical protein